MLVKCVLNAQLHHQIQQPNKLTGRTKTCRTSGHWDLRRQRERQDDRGQQDHRQPRRAMGHPPFHGLFLQGKIEMIKQKTSTFRLSGSVSLNEVSSIFLMN
jgi:hypothetical protein